MSREDLAAYYSEDYYTGAHPQGYRDYEGRGERRKGYFRSLVPGLRRHLPQGALRVLDIGCATGLFLEVAAEQGWRPSGVEFSSYAARQARSRTGAEVFEGPLEGARLPSRTFHLVTLWDVVEHLTDPKATLREAHRVLADGGILAVSTGDLGGFTARVYGARWALLAPPGHLFYFSRRTLYAMLRKVGFEPIEWQSDGAFLLNHGDTPDGERGLPGFLERPHHNRWVNAVLRRLRLGSIITVFARRCGVN